MESSSVSRPENPLSTKPAVEWISRPSRPRLDLPSSRATRSSGSSHLLERLAQHELARVEDEGLVAVLDLDQLGEVVHRLAHVDVRVARVVEDAEAAVHAHVDAGRLDEPLVVGVYDDPSSLDLGTDRAVAQHHGRPSLDRRGIDRPRAARYLAFKFPGARADTGIRMEEMETGGDQTHYVKRVVLPSGKTIEVVYFKETEVQLDEAQPSSTPPRSLTRTFTCASSATPSWCTPSHWDEAGPENWNVLLHCPNCDVYREGVFAQDTVEAFDEELDRGADALARDYKRLMRANMAEEIDRFAGALQADAILPEDF